MNDTSSRGWLLSSLALLLTIVLVILVWNRQPTIYPYLAAAVALASLVVLSIIGYHRGQVGKSTTIFLILVVYVLLRNVQFVATHYSAMQPGDVVQEYAVINTFSQAGRLFVIPRGESSIMLNWYSSWPALHSLSLIFADVLGIELPRLPVVLPTILSIIGFALVYLLADKLAGDLKLSKVVVPIALLLYAISPEAIYFDQKFVHQGMGTVLVFLLFYLVHRYLINRDIRILALATFTGLLLVATHHYTSFVFMLYLLALGVVTLFVARAARRIVTVNWLGDVAKLRGQTLTLGLVALVISGAILAWWSTIGTALLEGPAMWTLYRIRQFFQQLIMTVTPPAVGAASLPAAGALGQSPGLEASASIAPHLPRYLYPLELMPPWVKLLWLRDVLIYAPVFFGFAWLIKQNLKKRFPGVREPASLYLLLFSLSFFGVLFLFELFISKVEPYRVVLLGLPFIAMCGATLYAQMLSHEKWLLYAGFSLVVFAVTMSFLGLWGHTHAPVHLYSSAVSPQEVGEATPLNERHYSLQAFVNANHLAERADVIVSDNNAFLYLLLSPEQYNKFGLEIDRLVPGLKKEIDSGDNLMVVDFNTNLYSYYSMSSGTIGPEGALKIREQYRSVLEGSLNKVYDNTFEVWVR